MATAAPQAGAGATTTTQSADINDLTLVPTEGSSSSGAHLPKTSSPDHPQPQAHHGHSHHRNWGNNPLAHYWSAQSGGLLGPAEASFAPGYMRAVPPTKFANPAPLGLAGFAFTTFVLSLINLNTRGTVKPNIIVGPAFAYGGLVQLLAGMWEMACGNTFAAWVFPSYGAFWICIAIIFTPGGFGIAEAYGGETYEFYTAVGFFVLGYFIFTFLVWLCTFRSTLAFSSLLLSVWLAFLCLGLGYLDNSGAPGSKEMVMPNKQLILAGGAFGIIAAFLAWYVMFEGLTVKDNNSFFDVPQVHFPWSPRGRPVCFLDSDLEALEKEE